MKNQAIDGAFRRGDGLGHKSEKRMTEPFIAQLEQALFDQILKGRRQKVAMVIAMAAENFPGFWDEERTVLHAKIEEALARLVGRDGVLAFGECK